MIRIARDRGLRVPLAWTSDGSERAEILELLDSMVDPHMPDVTWSDDATVGQSSTAPGYWSHVTSSLAEMHPQGGDIELVDTGLTTRGLLVRHLVMPWHVETTTESRRFVPDSVGRHTSRT